MSSNHGYGFKQPPDRRRKRSSRLTISSSQLAADNLDPADIILFNLQFEERGGAGTVRPFGRLGRACGLRISTRHFFAEVVIGLADTDGGEINDIFARVLLCREKIISCAIFCGVNNL